MKVIGPTIPKPNAATRPRDDKPPALTEIRLMPDVRSTTTTRGKAGNPWQQVSAEEWNSWKWQLANLVRTPAQLSQLLHLPDDETAALGTLQQQFRFAVSPYYFSLIDPDDPADPIRRMIVPSSAELTSTGVMDPLAEKEDQVAPGLTHRYPDRVLLVVTSFCSSYCRFCIRKRNWKHSDAASSRDDVDAALDYIRRNEQITDVLISGGDPLTLPLERLEYVLKQLKEIPHVTFVRIGSREPVMLPMRIDEDLLRMLDRNGPIWLNTHFESPARDHRRIRRRLRTARAGRRSAEQPERVAGRRE